ncbi:hypothetical protein D3C87_1943840 [compost metagenome]
MAPGAVGFDSLIQRRIVTLFTQVVADLVKFHGFSSPNGSVMAIAAGCSLPHPQNFSVQLL